MMFGLATPTAIVNEKGEPVRFWGCRAIDDRGMIDIVFDRTTYNGPEHDTDLVTTEFDKLPFIFWLNTFALPELRQISANMNDQELRTLKDPKNGRYGVHIRRSGGYFYIGAWEHHTDACKYDLVDKPEGKWTNEEFDPNIGDRVKITFNGFGAGVVVSYFVEHGYRGVRVKLDKQPQWHFRQGQPPYALVCGPEVVAE